MISKPHYIQKLNMPNNHLSFNHVQVVTSPENIPPFDVEIEAYVYEQDTALVLGPTYKVEYPSESIEQLIEQALETPPLIPGSVLVRGQYPFQLLAIIHDLDHEPTWQEEWIVTALHSILRQSEMHQLQSIAMPLLGTVHGSLQKERFWVLLRSVIEQASPVYLKQIWIVVP